MHAYIVNDKAIILKSIGRVYHLTEIMADGNVAEDKTYWCDHQPPTCIRKVLSMKVDGVYTDLSNPAGPLTLYK